MLNKEKMNNEIKDDCEGGIHLLHGAFSSFFPHFNFRGFSDAAWEEQDAYVELLEQYSRCDMLKCKCRRGRDYNTQAGYVFLVYI